MDASQPGSRSTTTTLTLLQREILVLAVNGLGNGEIADRLGLTPGLVGTHIGRLTRTLGLTSRAQLVAVAVTADASKSGPSGERTRQ